MRVVLLLSVELSVSERNNSNLGDRNKQEASKRSLKGVEQASVLNVLKDRRRTIWWNSMPIVTR